MADTFVKKIYHIRGRPQGLAYEQNHSEEQLMRTGKLEGSFRRVRESKFFQQLRKAKTGDIFIYDGHGEKDGFMVMRNSSGDRRGISGGQLREVMKGSKAIIFLNCCFAAFIASHNGDHVDKEALRNCIANMLLYSGDEKKASEEVTNYLKQLEGTEDVADPADLAKRLAMQLKTLGLDRTFFSDRIVPLSISKLDVSNDAILIALGLETIQSEDVHYKDADFSFDDDKNEEDEDLRGLETIQSEDVHYKDVKDFSFDDDENDEAVT